MPPFPVVQSTSSHQESSDSHLPSRVTTIAHDLQDPDRVRTEDVLVSTSVTSFDQLFLPVWLQKGLRHAGFFSPSPIQVQAIPQGLLGFDLIVQAKSGTGKTLVFAVLSLASLRLVPGAVSRLDRIPQALILTPTREIAVQATQTCHIAVATPGRAVQLIDNGHLRLSRIRIFVLDEADAMVMQMNESVDWIMSHLPPKKQILALSATYPHDLSRVDRSMYALGRVYRQLTNKTAILLQLLTHLEYSQCLEKTRIAQSRLRQTFLEARVPTGRMGRAGRFGSLGLTVTLAFDNGPEFAKFQQVISKSPDYALDEVRILFSTEDIRLAWRNDPEEFPLVNFNSGLNKFTSEEVKEEAGVFSDSSGLHEDHRGDEDETFPKCKTLGLSKESPLMVPLRSSEDVSLVEGQDDRSLMDKILSDLDLEIERNVALSENCSLLEWEEALQLLEDIDDSEPAQEEPVDDNDVDGELEKWLEKQQKETDTRVKGIEFVLAGIAEEEGMDGDSDNPQRLAILRGPDSSADEEKKGDTESEEFPQFSGEPNRVVDLRAPKRGSLRRTSSASSCGGPATETKRKKNKGLWRRLRKGISSVLVTCIEFLRSVLERVEHYVNWAGIGRSCSSPRSSGPLLNYPSSVDSCSSCASSLSRSRRNISRRRRRSGSNGKKFKKVRSSVATQTASSAGVVEQQAGTDVTVELIALVGRIDGRLTSIEEAISDRFSVLRHQASSPCSCPHLSCLAPPSSPTDQRLLPPPPPPPLPTGPLVSSSSPPASWKRKSPRRSPFTAIERRFSITPADIKSVQLRSVAKTKVISPRPSKWKESDSTTLLDGKRTSQVPEPSTVKSGPNVHTESQQIPGEDRKRCTRSQSQRSVSSPARSDRKDLSGDQESKPPPPAPTYNSESSSASFLDPSSKLDKDQSQLRQRRSNASIRGTHSSKEVTPVTFDIVNC
ncbi:unnamed protein product [Cyprideis torosa]|uniref:Uncharacterized protein n=1 Tax=Cyprideis torosa TaxID=163714 RepID=A0A7R8W0Y9_9CRUS|nr:unnamed protein product [Cyprideis torosa]CAG0879284.1 unnamed protein product [Cyprideis torosa]